MWSEVVDIFVLCVVTRCVYDEKVLAAVFYFLQVTADVAQLLGEQKVDAILCVAGGWAGGSCSSKGQNPTFLFVVTLIISHVSTAAMHQRKTCIQFLRTRSISWLALLKKKSRHYGKCVHFAPELEVWGNCWLWSYNTLLMCACMFCIYWSTMFNKKIKNTYCLSDLYKNSDLMWKQSVWTSTISSHLASLHLKPGGLLTLAGAKAALSGTGGEAHSCIYRSHHDDLVSPCATSGFRADFDLLEASLCKCLCGLTCQLN